jgi:hypothetical protein
MKITCLALCMSWMAQPTMAAPPEQKKVTDAAQIDQAPNPSKLRLIREFLKLTGVQEKIDSGSFLEMYALPGQPVFASAASGGATFKEAVERGFAALQTAYSPHKHVWQEGYESHLNWEFTEEELAQIVAFLRTPAGQHYLVGRWRTEAYTETNTEKLVEQIVRDAAASLTKKP